MPPRSMVATYQPVRSGTEYPVPTLFRLLLVIGVLAALVWGTMLAMTTYLRPHPRAITRDISLPPRR